MTIRRRLILSFLTILSLFGLNLVIYFWGNHRRQAAVEDLRRAVARQLLISGIRENLDRIQKQVSLLGQGVADPSGAAVRPEEVAQFRQYWISKIFRLETSSGPKIVYSTDMAAELVTAIPGAVAFMDSAIVPKSLKIVKIDGRSPGDKGYRLH